MGAPTRRRRTRASGLPRQRSSASRSLPRTAPCAPRQPPGCAASTASASTASASASTATGAVRSRSSRRATSAPSGRFSRRSATPSWRCATPARSATRSCAGSSATSTSRTRASISESPAPSVGGALDTHTRRLAYRDMPPLKTNASYVPTGAQPRAIASLSEGIQQGERYQTLLGATGTGKTATMAWIIEQTQRPALVIAHNKTLAAQLCNEFREFFPENAVEYFVSYYDYYQPEAYVPQADLYIEKDSSINQEIERLRHAATASLFGRRDTIVVASVSCIFGLGSPEKYDRLMLMLKPGEMADRDGILRKLVDIQYTRNDTALGRGTFRV